MTGVCPAVGIDDLSFATASNVLDLGLLAEHHGIDPNKYRLGIGQDAMSVLAEDEDIVTMGADAAKQILDRNGSDGVRTLLFATESGVDESKSAGVFVHGLLGLSPNCRVLELKQACYSATGALQLALGIVARDPSQRVLVIASDNARYDLDSSGEPTQGAAAVAMLVSAEPRILAIEPTSGLYTQDVMDFWRPIGRDAAIADGKFSILTYLDAVKGAWSDYRDRGGAEFGAVDRFCYHQPFTKMATKAHQRLATLAGAPTGTDLESQIADSMIYNRRIGNSYTASIYLALLSLLDHDASLEGLRIGFFSYGSGAVSEFFAGVVQPGYRDRLAPAENQGRIDRRTAIDYERYAELYRAHASDLEDAVTPVHESLPFRFVGVNASRRVYARQ